MKVYEDDYTFSEMYQLSDDHNVYLKSDVYIKDIPKKVYNWENIRDFTGKKVHVYVTCTKITFDLLTKYIESRENITIELEESCIE